jgi:2,3-bisphosphoglycerate-independent phosphoglycerate mutase
VPVLLVDGDTATLACGRLADVAPTLLDLMGLPKPAEMTGVTLLRLEGKTRPESDGADGQTA